MTSQTPEEIPNTEEELEETVEPDKVFDCFDEGCEECTVCKYLNFREWAEGCAPAGSSIERNQLVDDYLKRKHQQLQKAQEELSQERTGFLDHIAKLEKTHQEELQKARHVWLREKIVKLEWMKVKNEHNSECLHNEAPEYCDCDNYIKWNQALQTIIDYYQAELDTTSPVYKFFTAPEEVRRPAIEEALKKASQEQSELDQDVSK